MHNFFHHCQSMEMSEQASEGELVKYLKVCRHSFFSNTPREKCNTPFVHAPSKYFHLAFKGQVRVCFRSNVFFFSYFLSSQESPCDGGSCDGQLSANHPQPAVLCPNQSHTRGRGCQCDQASHTCTQMHEMLGSSRSLFSSKSSTDSV